MPPHCCASGACHLLLQARLNVMFVVCCLSQVMKRDADVMRQDGPTLFTQAKNTVNIDKVAEHILSSYALAVGASSS